MDRLSCETMALSSMQCLKGSLSSMHCARHLITSADYSIVCMQGPTGNNPAPPPNACKYTQQYPIQTWFMSLWFPGEDSGSQNPLLTVEMTRSVQLWPNLAEQWIQSPPPPHTHTPEGACIVSSGRGRQPRLPEQQLSAVQRPRQRFLMCLPTGRVLVERVSLSNVNCI